MIYKNAEDSALIKSFNVSAFRFRNFGKKKGIAFDYIPEYSKPNQNVEIRGDLKGKSFNIESLPAGSQGECVKIGLENLDDVKCTGKIKISSI